MGWLYRRTTLLAGLIAAIAMVGLIWLAALTWFERAGVDRLRDETARTARQQARLFTSDLARFRLLPIVLGEYTDLFDTLRRGDPDATRRMNGKLALLAQRTGAPVLYLLDRRGRTVSASNAGTAESFVGRDYRFRPYFIRAMQQGAAEYYAVGNVSGRPGLFLARRIGTASDPAGVIIVKVEFDDLTRAWSSDPGQTLVADGRGILLFATDAEERFRITRPLSAGVRADIARSGQFGDAPLSPSRYRFAAATARGPGGEDMLLARTSMPLAGWQLLHVVPTQRTLSDATALARLTTIAASLAIAALLALFLWRSARAAQAARYRASLERAVAERTAALRAEIAERTEIDRRFREAREELAQANRLGSLGSITAGLVHEINQPVATIRTLSENAQHHLASGRIDRVAANLSTTVDLTARIGAITQEMRRFARRGTGTIGPVPLDAVIAGALLLVGDRFRGAGVALALPPAGQPLVRAGRVRLEQVLVNLLTNALEAVRDTPDPRVEVQVEQSGDRVLLTVADNGPGIDPVIADDIFQPFVTGKVDGLGLGLGIVRDIVTEFGGMVTVVPSSSGATFRVILHKGTGDDPVDR
ncbi:sensor histidine kinase [Sphingomonas sp. Leaf62]|uniref:sensor histidine kinase n=1 Tax=Sphingomonas sp. Leaf62 TaxID=1736228 RepID=UPI000AAC30D9|nr:ATP-binding protein [Sphingomonas sp. Leaf62]